MVASSLLHHMEITHGVVLPHNRGADIGRGGMETYMVSFPGVLKLVACPIYG